MGINGVTIWLIGYRVICLLTPPPRCASSRTPESVTVWPLHYLHEGVADVAVINEALLGMSSILIRQQGFRVQSVPVGRAELVHP